MFRQIVSFVALMTLTAAAFGKGQTVSLSITGPSLTTPIHTTDEAAIDVSVWGGQFADWEAGAVNVPSDSLERYTVHFWVQVPRGTVQMKYVIDYVWDPETERALVYLPGPRNIWHQTNVYSILRRGQDGHWFHATQPWANAIKRVLQNR